MFNAKIAFLKDAIDQLNTDIKEIEEINIIKRKIDTIMAMISGMKNQSNEEPSENKNLRQTIPLEGKFLEASIYYEFVRSYKLTIEGINLRLDELRKLIDEILLELKKKVSDKDLKNLEGNWFEL